MKIDTEKIRYQIFNSCSSFQIGNSVSVHNQVFEFWHKIWTDVFNRSESPESLNIDDFYRQHFVHVLTYEDDVVACSFSTFFHLGNTFASQLSYFHSFPQPVLDDIRANIGLKAMSVEYLTAHPQWRKNEIGLSLGALLVGLSLKLAQKSQTDVVFGTPRKDIKANVLASSFGFQTLKDVVMKCNYECEVMAVPTRRIVPYPDLRTQFLINELWKNKNPVDSYTDQEKLVAAA